MSNLLATILLAKDYAFPPIDNTAFSNLSTWSVVSGTVNTQSSTHLNIFPLINSEFAVKSPTLTPVDYTFGSTFRVTVTIASPGSSGSAQAVLYRGGVQLPDATKSLPVAFSSGTSVVNFDVNPGGYIFDEVRIEGYVIIFGTIDFSVPSIITLDTFAADFTEGDQLKLYWNTDHIEVVRVDYPGGAETLVTEGPNLGVLLRTQVTGITWTDDHEYGLSDYRFCDGPDLSTFRFVTSSPSFPYISRYISHNAIACASDSLVCDCAFDGEPYITPASTPFSADGQVVLNGSSSHADFTHPVRFSRGISPMQPEGEWENLTLDTIGVWNGLAAGTYTFYVVDQYNCFQAKTIIVPSSVESYNPKYKIEYKDVMTGITSVSEVLERGFGGDPVYSQGGSASPFSLSKNNNALNDKFDVLRPTFAKLTLNSQRHFQYLGLFSQDDRKYKIRWTHGSSSWIGYLTPSVYSEDYSPSRNYPVELTAADNLKVLDQIPFEDDSNQVITGVISLRQALLQCLKKTDMNLNVLIGVNQYTPEMDDTEDPLGQTFIDARAFMDDTDNPVTCEEAIAIILKPFGAFVQQKDQKWHIIESDAQTQPYQYREFDYAGTYVGSGTYDPQQIISTPSVLLEHILFSDANHNLEILPAYGKITITQKLKLKKSVFPPSLDQWQVNGYYGGYGLPLQIEGSRDKGLQLDLTSGKVIIVSPVFRVLAFTGYMTLSMKYLINLFRSVAFFDPVTGINYPASNVPAPPWTRFTWRLALSTGSEEFYFNDRIGWGKIEAISTSVTSIAIPTSHPTSKTLTIDTGLTLNVGGLVRVQYDLDSDKYFRATITSYNSTTGVLVVSSFANSGTGTFTDWTIYSPGPEYRDNYIFTTEFANSEKNWETDINMPYFTSFGQIEIQLTMEFEPAVRDFTTLAELKAIPTAIFPLGTRIRGIDPDNSFYARYYELRNGTDANSSPIHDIVRGNDFNSSTNAVVWDSSTYDSGGVSKFNYTMPVRFVYINEILLKCFPGGEPPEVESKIVFNNNPNFKEVLVYEVLAGDMPNLFNARKELYENIFLLADGTNTTGWKRRLVAENTPVLTILMKSLSNQYTKPSWRLSGNWIGPDITFVTIIKQTIRALGFAITNPENPNGTGWSQSGSGQPWGGTSGYCSVNFDPSHVGNSTYVKQSNSVISGTRLRVSFSLERLGSSGSRTDRFVMVLFSGSAVVQKITLLDGISMDSLNELALLFNSDSDADIIGFFIENITGTGTCEYRLSYTRGSGVTSVRYYFINKVDRNDRHNLYNAELVQLSPLFQDTDVAVDNTGGGNTDGGLPGSGGGADGGNGFGEGFSSGFGGGFGF